MKNGFTLAEVLITLGIIGIVAAMTLPSLLNNTQNKQLETSLKKSYSALGQVAQQVFLLDYGGQFPVNDNRNFFTLVNNFSKYYVNAKRCDGKTAINGCPVYTTNSSEFMRNNYKSYNGKNAGTIANDALSNTVDNTTIFFDYATDIETIHGQIHIAIDVNGWQKKPNKWGHDIFMFYINNNGKFLPMGDKDSNWPAEQFCSLTSTSPYNGYGCTIKAINEIDYFKNLPK